MTKEGLGFLKIWFEGYLNRFCNKDGILHPMLEMKRCHSIRVAENAKFIASALNVPESEQYLAEGVGLIHDIGRFNQFAQHGSYRDADTVDHGAEGRRVLETENLPFPCKPEDRELLLCSVEYHNKNVLDIPVGFSYKQDRLLRLIRDADKLDIMDVVLQTITSDGFKDLPTMLPHIRLCREVSPEVLKEAQNTQSVLIGNLSTLGDFLIMVATWFYDLNYPPALRLAVEQDILFRIQRELPETEAANGLFASITTVIQKTGGITNISVRGGSECIR